MQRKRQLRITAVAALAAALGAGLLAAERFDWFRDEWRQLHAPNGGAFDSTEPRQPPAAPPAKALSDLERAWLTDPGEPRPPQVRTASRRPPPPSDPEARGSGPAEAIAVPIGDAQLVMDVRRVPVPGVVLGANR